MRIVEVTEMPFVTAIKKDCQPYLQSVIDPLMLFRGMTYGQGFIRKKVRKDDRTPKAASMSRHNLVNDYFIDRFGIPFRNGIFCIPNLNVASGFGEVYVIFPIGKYEALWSPKVADLNYFFDDDEFDDLRAALDSMDTGSDEYMHTVGELWDVMDSQKWIRNRLDDAWAFKNEIMIWCDHYYALPLSYITGLNASYATKEALDDFRKKLQ
jgi:hypothetical protein